MIRLFVALDLPEEIRERLGWLEMAVPGARWVPEEDMHITLRFIGEVTEDVAADIDTALARVSAPQFDIHLDGVGAFGSKGRTRALWAGVRRDPPLLHLQAKIEQALIRLGLPPEGRKFQPHVTLARMKDVPAERCAKFLHGHAGFRAGPVPVRHFTLFSSFLSKSGPLYTPEADYSLRGVPPGQDLEAMAAEWGEE